MLDINQFIEEKGGNPELIRQSQKARYASVELVDEIIADYKDWVKTRFELDVYCGILYKHFRKVI